MLKLRARFTPVAIGIAAAALLAGPAQATLRSRLAAGYQANHQTSHQPFRYIAASWTVPPLDCPGPIASGASDGDSYFYVALASGRFGSGQGSVPGAEQVGVRELCAGILPAYTAYAVMNGAYEIQSVTPSPGDVIFASVYYRAGRYRFALRDQPENKSFSFWSACGGGFFGGLRSTCGRSTADIAVGTGIPGLTLARYGAAAFSNVAIVDARGHHGSLASNRHWKVSRYDEYDASRLVASASALSRRGTQFSDRWRHF